MPETRLWQTSFKTFLEYKMLTKVDDDDVKRWWLTRYDVMWSIDVNAPQFVSCFDILAGKDLVMNGKNTLPVPLHCSKLTGRCSSNTLPRFITVKAVTHRGTLTSRIACAAANHHMIKLRQFPLSSRNVQSNWFRIWTQ